VCVAFIARFLNINLTNLIWGVFIFVWSLLCMIIWATAGFIVFKSLFTIGAGLSVLFFLVQSYCVSTSSYKADDALKGLFIFGLLYVCTLFIYYLYKDFTIGFERFKEIYNDKKIWIVLSLFAIFTGIFLWQLFQVMYSIIDGLCIFK